MDETDAPQSSASAYTFNDSLMAYNDNSYVLENADYISLTDIASVKNEIMKKVPWPSASDSTAIISIHQIIPITAASYASQAPCGYHYRLG
ncbi:MAG: hypothetical protein LKM35_03960 [Lachnospiraceae bacterium]|nr:hypothetical protein [Lachnospiraceae bacterium]